MAERVQGDEGFTLVEILAAMIVFALAASATAGMLVTGLRASLVAKLDTGAKNLAQERVEVMRNLPFHLDFKPGVPAAQSMDDLLNNYYTNTTSAANKDATGYVGPCGAQTVTCSGRQTYEPQNGSFYRVVLNPVPGYTKYRQYISTQFVDANRVPLGPPTGYNSLADGADQPPSQFAFVSTTTFWTAGSLTKSYTLETYVSAGRPATSRIAGQARAAALAFSTSLDTDSLLTLQAGTLSLDGSFGSGTLASGRTLAAYADITGISSAHVDGSLLGANAPPNLALSSTTGNAQAVTFEGRTVASFANTSATMGAATVSTGLPNVGSAGKPTTSQLVPQGAGQTGLTAWPLTALDPRLRVDVTKPLAWVSQTTGGTNLAQSTGYLTSTGGVTHSVRSAATSSALAVHLFPTSFAPDGVVKVLLSGAWLTCNTDGTTPNAWATLTYSVHFLIADGAGGYRDVLATEANATDPLSAYPPATTMVGVDPTGANLYLSDYITGWGALGTAGVAAGKQLDPDGNKVTASYTGVAALSTIPLRQSDPASGLSLQLGQLSCIAEDNR